MRKIVHVDMDAFYASVEQRDDPTLRGRPLVVAWRGPRSVVCAASYEARKFGIRSAMPAVRAERLCPDLLFVAPDFSRYKAVSVHVREIFARHSALIEPLSLDEAYLDVSQPLSGLSSATAVAEAIRASIREELSLTASAGVAPNKFLAKIASDWRKPDGLFVIRPHQVETFLCDLPVSKLPGVGKVMQSRLAELGVISVSDLRLQSAVALQQTFGSWGLRLHELAHGHDQRPVQNSRPTRSVSSETTLVSDQPLHSLWPQVQELAARTWRASRREGRVAATVILKLKTSDFRILSRSISPNRLPDSAEYVAELAWSLRERVDLPAQTLFRLVGVGLSNFADDQPGPTQVRLFE